MNHQKISFLILRLGLAATYVYSGLDLILHPTAWIAFVPGWFQQLLPIGTLAYLQLQGGVELILALGLIFGIGLRWVSFISAAEMLAILGLYGFDGVTFRDLAILGGSLSVFFATFVKPVASASDNSPGLVMAPKRNLSDIQKRFRTILVVTAFVLFSIILIGLFWLSQTTRDQAGWLAFSYATGLSMIVLPCTLPLAFVIVPLAMGKDSKKGLAIAIAFALGVTITLSIYGAIIAKLGQVVGLDKAKDIMYTIAGIFAVVFGLGELGLIKMRVPTYSGAFPKFIQERKDVGKGFLLGLLLGNVGLGCPNPAFYVLLSHIATVGSMSTGWFLTFIHAVGRVTPLLLLAILGVLGVDALSVLVKRKDAIARVTAWGVVGVGAFILTFGLLGHDWYVYSGIHSVLELVTQEASFVTQYAEQFGGLAHAHGVPTGPYLKYGSWLMVTLIVIPMIWSWRRKYRDVKPEDIEHRQTLHWMGAYLISFALFLYLLFGITLPNWFIYKVAPAELIEGDHEMEHFVSSPREHIEVVVAMTANPQKPKPGQNVVLEFTFRDRDTNQAVTELEIAHGKPMHLVGLRKEDLGNFIHIHPELKNDSYMVQHRFSEPGTYVFWPEAVYQGMQVVEKMPDLIVGTPPIISYLPALDRTLRLEDELVVQLKGPVKFEAGKKTLFGFSVTDAGGFDATLGKYLEENAHVTIVSQDLKHFHHLHANYGMVGEEHETGGHTHSFDFPLINNASAHGGIDDDHAEQLDSSAFGPKDLVLNFNFPDPGLYKIFVEFVTADNLAKVNRAEYWVNVEGTPTAAGAKGITLPKWALAVISLVIIGSLMPFVINYLNEEKIKV